MTVHSINYLRVSSNSLVIYANQSGFWGRFLKFCMMAHFFMENLKISGAKFLKLGIMPKWPRPFWPWENTAEILKIIYFVNVYMLGHYGRWNWCEKSIASIHFTIQGSHKSVLTTPTLDRGNFLTKIYKIQYKIP